MDDVVTTGQPLSGKVKSRRGGLLTVDGGAGDTVNGKALPAGTGPPP
jgi:hypothetical protein